MSAPVDAVVHRCVPGGMRFVFLDIDGVLLPYRWMLAENKVCKDILPKTKGCPAFDPDCVAELNMICSAGRASIIVSSSWRQHIPCLDTMRLVLREQGVDAPISGMTPIADGEWDSWDRGDEVRHFMEPLDVEAFVILDDADMGWMGYEDRWVQPAGAVGLQRGDAKRAIDILCRK